MSKQSIINIVSENAKIHVTLPHHLMCYPESFPFYSIVHELEWEVVVMVIVNIF